MFDPWSWSQGKIIHCCLNSYISLYRFIEASQAFWQHTICMSGEIVLEESISWIFGKVYKCTPIEQRYRIKTGETREETRMTERKKVV